MKINTYIFNYHTLNYEVAKEYRGRIITYEYNKGSDNIGTYRLFYDEDCQIDEDIAKEIKANNVKVISDEYCKFVGI